MLKALGASAVFLLVLASADLAGVYAINPLGVDSEQRAESPYAGRYEAKWTAAPTSSGCYSGGKVRRKETWDISIAPDGKITGAESEETGGTAGQLSGSIKSGKEGGSIKLVLKHGEVDNTLKGTVTRRGWPRPGGGFLIYLMGQLKVYRSNGDHCGNIVIFLTPK